MKFLTLITALFYSTCTSLSCILHVDACLFNILFFIGSDCKTERVGIRIKELAFKQPFKNQASSEFKDLESSLLSAVSYFRHALNWDGIYMP